MCFFVPNTSADYSYLGIVITFAMFAMHMDYFRKTINPSYNTYMNRFDTEILTPIICTQHFTNNVFSKFYRLNKLTTADCFLHFRNIYWIFKNRLRCRFICKSYQTLCSRLMTYLEQEVCVFFCIWSVLLQRSTNPRFFHLLLRKIEMLFILISTLFISLFMH